MSRVFRILGKKKGSRQTGSLWWAGAGEVLFAACLILVGVVLLVLFTTLQIQNSTKDRLYISLWYFIPEILVAIFLVVIGCHRVLAAMWRVGASVERRGAILSKAREINLLNEVRPKAEEIPYVPIDLLSRASPGLQLKYRLHSNFKATWKITMSLLVCLLFVSITTILVLVMLRSFERGKLDLIAENWISIGLLIMMGLASVWSFYFFLRQLLSQTGIGPTRLEISQFPVRPGNQVQVVVTQPGRVRLKLFHVSLVCIEQANFNQGTDVRHESRTVQEIRLVRKRGIQLDPKSPLVVEAEFRVPENAMHSFRSANNKVLWRIVVHCHAKGWPRVERTYPILMLPRRARSAEVA